MIKDNQIKELITEYSKKYEVPESVWDTLVHSVIDLDKQGVEMMLFVLIHSVEDEQKEPLREDVNTLVKKIWNSLGYSDNVTLYTNQE